MPKLRAGSAEAAILLSSDSLEEWTAAFNSYEESVRRLSQEKGRDGLLETDRWWRTDFPAALRSRGEQPFITKEELVKVVQWKMWMGVVRPNLLRFATETNPEKVKAKSREAFQNLPRRVSPSTASSSETAEPEAASRVAPDALKRAVTTLTSDLKGVGPATASAVLAALCGGCPFDADEVIDAVMETGVRKYTLPEYLQVHEALDRKATQLGKPWNAERVRRALWSRAMHSRFDLTVAPCVGGSKSCADSREGDGGSSVLVGSEGSQEKEDQKGCDRGSAEKSGVKRHKSRR